MGWWMLILFRSGKDGRCGQTVAADGPNNLKAMYLIAAIEKQQAAANPAQAPQLLDDAAAMAAKGLAATKPTDVKDDDWKKQKAATDPFFYSVISNDDCIRRRICRARLRPSARSWSTWRRTIPMRPRLLQG
jgi:hypothetical protein